MDTFRLPIFLPIILACLLVCGFARCLDLATQIRGRMRRRARVYYLLRPARPPPRPPQPPSGGCVALHRPILWYSTYRH